MYEAKIPGTRYVCALTNVKGQWMIQIKLDDVVEGEAVVKEVSERGMRDNIKSVLSEVNMYLNDFMVDQITRDITTQAQILFRDVSATESQTTLTNVSAIDNSMEDVLERIKMLEERIKRIEFILEHRE